MPIGIAEEGVGKRIERKCLVHAFERPLAAATEAARRPADVAHLAAHVDQAAGNAARDHTPRASLRHEERRLDVEIVHRVEIGLGHLPHRLWAVGAGVVDEHVERRSCRKEGRHGVQVTDVEHGGHRLATGGDDGIGCRLDFVGGAGDQRHFGARLGQRRRRCQPDPAPRAGHQRAPAVEPETGGARQVSHAPLPQAGEGQARWRDDHAAAMLARWIVAKLRTCACANSISLRSCAVRLSTAASISAWLRR